jgi:hypothetical protein
LIGIHLKTQLRFGASRLTMLRRISPILADRKWPAPKTRLTTNIFYMTPAPDTDMTMPVFYI